MDRDLVRVSYATVDSPYPFLLIIGQWQTQRHLDQRFGELGGSVLRGVRLLNLQPEFPGSAATVVDSDGELRVINARFVAGCDGVRSRVRNQLGIGFPGSSPEQMFAVADVRFAGLARRSGRDRVHALPARDAHYVATARRRHGAGGGVGATRNSCPHPARRQ